MGRELSEVREMLFDAREQLQDALEGIRMAEREMERMGMTLTAERCRSMVRSHIEMALDDEHQWIGGNMTTLADIIAEVEERAEGAEDFESDKDDDDPPVGHHDGLAFAHSDPANRFAYGEGEDDETHEPTWTELLTGSDMGASR